MRKGNGLPGGSQDFFRLSEIITHIFRLSEIRLKVAEMQKQKLVIEEELNKENKQKLEEAMDKAEEEYYKALNDIPGAWKLVGMQVTITIIHIPVTQPLKTSFPHRELFFHDVLFLPRTFR